MARDMAKVKEDGKVNEGGGPSVMRARTMGILPGSVHQRKWDGNGGGTVIWQEPARVLSILRSHSPYHGWQDGNS